MPPIRNRRQNDSPTILVIEDDADSRLMYSDYLRTKGWLVFTAADGRIGLDKSTDLSPDVVVLDLSMPRVDGWTVLSQLRDSSWTASIPIVVVSAVTDARDGALYAGADAYLAKPCSPEVLWLQIRAMLRWREARMRRRPRRSVSV